jgi:hypothetical protein
VLAGRTGPLDMLAPTAETRRELTTAADACVSSVASAWRSTADTPASRPDWRQVGHVVTRSEHGSSHGENS